MFQDKWKQASTAGASRSSQPVAALNLPRPVAHHSQLADLRSVMPHTMIQSRVAATAGTPKSDAQRPQSRPFQLPAPARFSSTAQTKPSGLAIARAIRPPMPVRSPLPKAAQAKMAGRPGVIQRLSADQIRDHYFDAYEARMSWRDRTHGHLDHTWTTEFFRFENAYLAMGDGSDPTTLANANAAWLRFHGQGALPRTANPSPAEVLAWQVWADMQNQFGRWDGTLTNRGAWWGSPGPGSTTNARAVPTAAIEYLRRIVSSSWVLSSSDSGGVSFKRLRGGINFIYHMLPP